MEAGPASGSSCAKNLNATQPSRLLTQFRPYDKPTLKSFAKHYVTGETLPDDMYNRLVAAKNFRSASSVLRHVSDLGCGGVLLSF